MEAAVPAREAYRIASDLGARPLQGELELLAQRARLDLADHGADEPLDPENGLGLTPREREVLQLLARGYTNGEIAAELTISVKTASVHVSHILRKLDVSSRIEAARSLSGSRRARQRSACPPARASATRWARERAPEVAIALRTWVRTVSCASCSSSAISGPVSPSATSRTISPCRHDSRQPSGGAGAAV